MSWTVKKVSRWIALAALSAAVTGCSALSASKLFSHYSAQNSPARQALAAGNYQQSLDLAVLSEGMLTDLEKGRVELLLQRPEQSQQQFNLAYREVQRLEEQAVISISDSAASIGALALNDNITDYLPPDYEVGYLHLYSALNYLQQSDLEGALIEMRRANRVQERALSNRESSLKRAESEMRNSGLDPNLGSVLSRYPDAGKSLQAVQNGYLFYLSALLFEADGDLNAAYIDIKRALAVNSNNAQIVTAAVRIGTKFGAPDEVKQMRQQYGSLVIEDELERNDQRGRVIVIQEVGVVLPMSEWRLTVPVYDSRRNTAFYSVALPYYGEASTPRAAKVSVGEQSLATNSLTDVNLMAKQSLTEQMPTILVRQVLRAITKDRIRKEASNGDDVGNAIFNIMNTLTEQPDTRSWQSLPAEVKSASAMISAGEQRVTVGQHELDIVVNPGQTTLVWVSQQSSSAAMWAVNLGKI